MSQRQTKKIQQVTLTTEKAVSEKEDGVEARFQNKFLGGEMVMESVGAGHWSKRRKKLDQQSGANTV